MKLPLFILLLLSVTIVIGATTGPLGCASKGGSPTPSSPVEAAEKGVLITDQCMSGPASSQGVSLQEALRQHAAVMRGLPPQVGVRIIEQSDNRLVVEYNHAMLQYFMAGRAGELPDPIPTTPVREVIEGSRRGGTVEMRHRMFYIGKDPTLAQSMRDGYKGTPLELKSKP